MNTVYNDDDDDNGDGGNVCGGESDSSDGHGDDHSYNSDNEGD